MRTARLETTCFSFSGHQMNMFEQVSRDHHQMSLERGSPGLMSIGVPGSDGVL